MDFIRNIKENIPPDQLQRVFVFDIRDRQPALFNICQAAGGNLVGGTPGLDLAT